MRVVAGRRSALVTKRTEKAAQRPADRAAYCPTDGIANGAADSVGMVTTTALTTGTFAIRVFAAGTFAARILAAQTLRR